MRVSIKYESKLRLDVFDFGVISTEILRLKDILKRFDVPSNDENLEKMRLWDEKM